MESKTETTVQLPNDEENSEEGKDSVPLEDTEEKWKIIKVEVESDSETKELESKTDDSKDTNTDMHTYQNFTMLDGALQGFTLPEEKYQCHLCKEAFFSEPLFHLHMESHAGVKPVIKPHVCPQCFTSFKRKSHLDQHMQTHSDVREYECKMCERSYKRKGELMRHLKSHSGERPFACNYCDKLFIRSSHLNAHQRIHSQWQEIYKIRPFVCDQCGQRYHRKADLQEHLLVHTDERPHACQWCDKAFRRKRHLKQHEKIHTGERWYCTDCDKSFARPHDLEYHKKAHLGYAPTYECTYCDKTFKSRSGLKFHESHHKYELVCPVCKLYFQNNTSLQMHVATDHADTLGSTAVNTVNELSVNDHSSSVSNVVAESEEIGIDATNQSDSNFTADDSDSKLDIEDKSDETQTTLLVSEKLDRVGNSDYQHMPADQTDGAQDEEGHIDKVQVKMEPLDNQQDTTNH